MFVRTLIRSVDITEDLLSQLVVYMVTTPTHTHTHTYRQSIYEEEGYLRHFLEVELSDTFASNNNEDSQ